MRKLGNSVFSVYVTLNEFFTLKKLKDKGRKSRKKNFKLIMHTSKCKLYCHSHILFSDLLSVLTALLSNCLCRGAE